MTLNKGVSMKSIFLGVLAMTFFSSISYVLGNGSKEQTNSFSTLLEDANSNCLLPKQKGGELNINNVLNSISANNLNFHKYAGSGCCSWHGGVCGCSFGKAICCDGAPSPSCGC